MLAAAANSSPDDFVIRERKASLLLNLGLRSVALPELRLLEKQWPAPLWLQARLALDYEQMGLLDDAARLAATVVAGKTDDREQLELLARFHERRHMKYDLQADYIALSRLEPSASLIFWSRLAQVQLDCGDAEGAKKSLLRMVALDEDNPDAHRRLAQVDESLHLEDQEAQQELAKASTATRPDILNSDVQYLADPAALVKAAFAKQPPAATQHWRIFAYKSFLPAGWTASMFSSCISLALKQRWIRIVSVPSAIRPPAEELHVIHARAWKPNGAVLDAQEFGDREYAETPVLHVLRHAPAPVALHRTGKGRRG